MSLSYLLLQNLNFYFLFLLCGHAITSLVLIIVKTVYFVFRMKLLVFVFVSSLSFDYFKEGNFMGLSVPDSQFNSCFFLGLSVLGSKYSSLFPQFSGIFNSKYFTRLCNF